jgi:hypothetical protein
MAENEEEVTLVFTVKGTDVAVRQIKSVEHATTGLDTKTKTAAKSSADSWERYTRATEGHMNRMARSMGVPGVAADAMSSKMAASMGRLVEHMRTSGTAVAAEASTAGSRAAASFSQGFLSGLGGLKGRVGSLLGGLGAGRAGGAAGGAEGGAAGAAAGGLLGGLGTAAKVGLGVGAGALALGAGAVMFGVGGMQGASDQMEYRNQTDSLLGKGASERAVSSTGSFAERNRIAATMGLTNTEYLKSYGGFAGQLKGAGLNQSAAAAGAARLVQGAADLGSFKNVSSADAAERLSAGVRGEFDSLDTIGIMLNQAQVDKQALAMFGKKTQELDIDKQVQARVAAIQNSAGWKQAQGDFTRSAPDSLENQRKIAAAELQNTQEKMGDSLNKILMAVMPLAEPLLGILDATIGLIAPLLKGLADILKPLATAIAWVLDKIKGTAETVGGMAGRAAGTIPMTPRESAENTIAGAVAVKQGKTDAEVIAAAKGEDKTHGGYLSDLGFATGGMVPGWSPGIDNMLVPLSGGEGILTPETTAMMGGAGAIDRLNAMGLRRRGGYANGTGSAQQAAAMWGQSKAALGPVQGIFQTLAAPAAAGGAAGSGGGGAYTGSLGGDLVIENGVVTEASFLSYAAAALKAKGMNPADAIHLLRQAQHESSLRVTAINNTDSNAQAGHPSQGILQFIPSTFAEYAEPGHTNFLDPRDQIWAALNYVPARYGSIAALGTDRGYGAYGAYDSGGWLNPGKTDAINKTGQPEAVLTADQWRDIKQVAGVGGGGSGVNVQIGSIVITGPSGSDPNLLASTINNQLADAIATHVNRTKDRRL